MLDDASVSNLALFWAWKQHYKHLVVVSEPSSYQLPLYVLSQNLPGSGFEEKEKKYFNACIMYETGKIARAKLFGGRRFSKI